MSEVWSKNFARLTFVLDVVYDADNKIVSYSGGPITMVNTTMQDESSASYITAFHPPLMQPLQSNN